MQDTGKFPEGFVEEVRGASSIVTVVGAVVNLKKAGTSYKGLCPFHNEKTPSFNVNESKQMFYCFGCQAGGDVFKFVMLHDRVSFPEAVRKVADLSGVPLPKVAGSPEDDRKSRLFMANEAALRIYRRTLAGPAGAAARDYLAKRGIEPETVERFELGLTPEGWEGVSAPLLREGFTQAELLAAGLAKEKQTGRGLYDRFHERLLFPIRNVAGRLAGFGGRTLTSQEPKYLNSPETDVYSKSDILYGLVLARDAIRKAEEIVLVEGYLDLIALHQAGIAEAVASLGTSLTERHAHHLARYARRVHVAYDGDKAGRAAAKRTLRSLLPERLVVTIVELEPGQDPDDFVRAKGGQAFRERMAQGRGFVPFLVGLARGDDPEGARTPAGRVRLVNEVLPILASIADPVERAMHVGALAEAAQIEDAMLLEAVRKAIVERKEEVAAPVATSGRAVRPLSPAERAVLLGLVSGEDLYRAIEPYLDPQDWAELDSRLLLDAARAAWAAGTPPTAATLEESLTGPGRDLLARAVLEGPEVTPEDAIAALKTLRAARLKQEFRQVQSRIATAGAGDLDALLVRKLELSRELDDLANG